MTDSSACIPNEVAAGLGIAVVPLMLVVDGREYADNAGPSREAFYRRLRGAGPPPSTAAPAPGALLERFRAAAGPVVCITVASAYSATHANARLAAEHARGDGIEVRVVDSETAAAAAGYVVRAAAQAALAGADLNAVVGVAEATRDQVGVLMLLESLDYLARGGRVPRVAAWASSLLHVRPIVELRRQQVRLAGRVQSRRRGLDRLTDLMARRGAEADHLHLTVQHADADTEAERLARLAAERLAPASLEVSEFSPVMAVHVGPGLLGFAYRLED